MTDRADAGLVERVARALFEQAEQRAIAACAELSADPSMWLTWDTSNEPTREPYREMAHAAIAALATPSPVEEGLRELLFELREEADKMNELRRLVGQPPRSKADSTLHRAANTIEALAGVLGLRDGP